MAIHERDYMKRRTDQEDERSSSLESRAEAMAERILAKPGKIIFVACITLGIVALFAWVMCRNYGAGH